MKKFISVLLAVMMVLSTLSFAAPTAIMGVDSAMEMGAQIDTSPVEAQEKDAEDNANLSAETYYIYTAEDMYNVRNDLAGTYYLMNDIDLSEYANWEPIGTYTSSATEAYAFTGIFDGQGFEISGIH